MKDDNLIFVMFVGCFAVLFMLALHFHQQRRIMEIQTQLDELKIIVDQKYLPALMLDKLSFSIR